MESVHSLSFGAAVLKVLKDAKIEDDSQGGGENDETRFCKTVFSASGARCPNNGTAGRYTLSRDRRESEILRTIGQEEANRQGINPIWIQEGGMWQGALHIFGLTWKYQIPTIRESFRKFDLKVLVNKVTDKKEVVTLWPRRSAT